MKAITTRVLAYAVVIFLTGCQARLLLPVDPSTTGLRLAVQTNATLRKNDCTSLQIEVFRGLAPASLSNAVSIAIQSSLAGTFYNTLEGCKTYLAEDEQQQFFLPSGTTRASVYFRPSVTGTTSISAQAIGYSQLVASQSVPVTFESFNPSRGVGGLVYRVFYDAFSDRIYVVGAISTFNDTATPGMLRLLPDGNLDTSFQQTGTGIVGSVYAIAVQADGKILVGGTFTSYNSIPKANLLRLNADGTLDTSFTQTGAGFDNSVQTIALQPDGKILLAGLFTSYNGTSRPRVCRLNTDGTLDGSFAQTGSGLNATVSSLVIQADGRLLVGGSFTSYNGTSRPYVTRLNSDGTLDSSFAQTGSGLSGAVNSIELQPDGKLLVAGAFVNYNGTARRYLARLNSDGTLDSTFAATGTGFSASILGSALQPDGKVLVVGLFTSYDGITRNYAARVNSDGTLDSTFVQVGTGLNAIASRIALQGDGKAIVSGSFYYYNGVNRPMVARINTDGSLDESFAEARNGFDGQVSSACAQPDGRVLVAGQFNQYDGAAAAKLTRLLADGSRDSSFNGATSGFDGFVHVVRVQPDGKILVGGAFNNYNGVSRPKLARLNSDGSLDTSFVQTGTGLNDWVQDIAVQADGKVLVGGYFVTYNGASRTGVARLNSNGSLDTSFALAGTGLNTNVFALALDANGKVIIGGAFTSYNGTSRPKIARLNSDGSLDSSFVQTGSGLNGNVLSLIIQPDNKLLVGGNFTNYNSISRPYIARINSDGSLDSTFAQVGSGFSGVVSKVELQSDGRVLVGGDFLQYATTKRQRIARLLPNGALDPTFLASGTGTDANVLAAALLSDGKMLMGGAFRTFGSLTARFLIRLTADGTLD